MFSGSSKVVQVKLSASILTTKWDFQDHRGREELTPTSSPLHEHHGIGMAHAHTYTQINEMYFWNVLCILLATIYTCII